MVDLDHFKSVNDTYGHPFGDIVLKRTAQVLYANLRKSDRLVRFGGEEFVGSLANVTLDKATDILERMRRAVEITPIFNDDLGKDIHVTVSIGYAVLANSQTAAMSLANADKALYKAKKARNTICAYRCGMAEG